MLTELLLLFFALFNLYLLWRIDRIEKEKTSYQDIKDIFEKIVVELGISDEEEY